MYSFIDMKNYQQLSERCNGKNTYMNLIILYLQVIYKLLLFIFLVLTKKNSRSKEEVSRIFNANISELN